MNVTNCIECDGKMNGERPYSFKCEKCKRDMCWSCNNRLWKGWIKSYNLNPVDFGSKLIKVCCTNCFTILAINHPNDLVKHPNSYIGDGRPSVEVFKRALSDFEQFLMGIK